MIRFGKPFGPLLGFKADYFARNDELLAEQERINQAYKDQPPRTACKMCMAPLGKAAFQLHGVGYAWCSGCGHLNGLHEDTEAFAALVYSQDDGRNYARIYAAADRDAYDRRVFEIYRPKAEFLRDALASEGESPESLQFADFGAGSGYFVAALKSIGLDNVIGWEPSPAQVALAESMLGPGRVHRHEPAAASAVAATLTADVVSMIGVLEHLSRPREVLSALSSNHRLRWLYISLPLAGPTVAIEALFPTVARRHLVAGHTHLFTESSIDRLCAEFGFNRIAEWWFGSDILDFYRSGLVRLQQKPETAGLCEMWRTHMLPALDVMQLALDERKLSTEVHLLLARS